MEVARLRRCRGMSVCAVADEAEGKSASAQSGWGFGRVEYQLLTWCSMRSLSAGSSMLPSIGVTVSGGGSRGGECWVVAAGDAGRSGECWRNANQDFCFQLVSSGGPASSKRKPRTRSPMTRPSGAISMESQGSAGRGFDGMAVESYDLHIFKPLLV